MNFLQRLSNYFFGKPKIENKPAEPVAAPAPQPEPAKPVVTPMFIAPEPGLQVPAPPPVEYPTKEVKIETKEPAPEATVTVSAPTVEVAPEPKKKRAPAKKKSTAKKK